MALFITRPKPTKAQKQAAYFADWYEKNRQRLSDLRRARYANDPNYRAAVLARSRAQRS